MYLTLVQEQVCSQEICINMVQNELGLIFQKTRLLMPGN